MKIIGIIAEYNPFHNGHAYQIATIRERTGADFVIVAMSGDFVQRGAPAILDKYARAQMALSCGADLVLELPALWATASAEHFAMAGVTLFEKMGLVNGICFGAETDNLPLLTAIADILADEPEAYRTLLASYLKTGVAFPKARASALADFVAMHKTSLLHNEPGDLHSEPGDLRGEPAGLHCEHDDLHDVLSSPNNILAIEYLKALRRRHSSMTPYLIRREGSGYHDTTLAPTASATGIREALFCGNASISVSMPAAAYTILQEYQAKAPLLDADDFSQILGYRLLTLRPKELTAFGDCSTDIANRIYKNRLAFSSYTSFAARNKRRDITYTRMSRILLHIILSITDDDYAHLASCDYIPYLRILGFRTASTRLFRELKNATHVPLISKLADASAILSPDALSLLDKDIFAADLYEQVKVLKLQADNSFPCEVPASDKKRIPRSEYSREILRISD